jgi:DNA-binding HxlR family transcriptional regulator
MLNLFCGSQNFLTTAITNVAHLFRTTNLYRDGTRCHVVSKKPTEKPQNAEALEAITRDLGAAEAAIRAIGGKWKIMIVGNLSAGALRFSEWQRRMPLISQQSLVSQLRELQRDGVVHRHAYAEVPARVEYSLTETGLHISPLMPNLIAWGYEIIEARANTAI